MRKVHLALLAATVLLLVFSSCAKKYYTVVSDTTLIQNPAEQKPVKVAGGELRRGEVVQLLEEKSFGGKKFLQVQIEKVSTKGWIDASSVSQGKIATASILRDTDFYSRPNLKSPKSGKAKAGIVVFVIGQEDKFSKVQFPGGEGYVEKNMLGDASAVVRVVVIPGLGKATVLATSTFKSTEGREDEYDVRNLFDGSLKTGWCEGKSDDNGIGESITLTFERPVNIYTIQVVNGLTASEAAYKNNNRVSVLHAQGSTYGSSAMPFEDNILDYQYGSLMSEYLEGTQVILRIDGVHAGKVKDTCISEIRLTGSEVGSSGYGGGYGP